MREHLRLGVRVFDVVKHYNQQYNQQYTTHAAVIDQAAGKLPFAQIAPQERYKLRKRGKDKASFPCLGSVNAPI